MSLQPRLIPARAGHCILVVDDDRRVVELLQVALNAHGYRVLSATNGDEAVRLATREQPDLIVLDVRLPRKSGLEVCEILRQAPDDPRVPIILVSALGETEVRVDGLGRGADDFITKPFSPKELVARIRTLLQRNDERRELSRRNRELESDVARAQEEVRRLHQELRRELSLKEVFLSLGRELHWTLDRETLAQDLLLSAQNRLGVGTTGLILSERPGEPFRAWAVRGLAREGWERLQLQADGELLRLLAGLGRPLRRAELERFPELALELHTLEAAGVVVIAPLLSPRGVEGMLLADEKIGGQEFTRLDIETVAAICDASAAALHNAGQFLQTQDSCLALAAGIVTAHEARTGRAGHTERVVRLCEGMAEQLGLSWGERLILRRAARLHELGRLLDPAQGPSDGPARAAAFLSATAGLERVAAVISGEETLGGSDPDRRLSQVLRSAERWEELTRWGEEEAGARERLLGPAGADLELEIREALLRASERETEASGDLLSA